MSLVAALMGKGENGFGYGSTAKKVVEGLDLSGKTYLVTGCNSGLGLETLRALGGQGARLVACARTVQKAEQALAQAGVFGAALPCELTEPASVRQCAQLVRDKEPMLDGIICNAGIMALPKLQQKLGYELQFFTNHVGHFILVTSLLPTLAPQGRVVMVSSKAHLAAPYVGIEFDNLSGERGYKPWRAYGQSKLANLLFARALAKRLPAGQTANALHPGVIRTNLGRHMNPLMRFGLGVAEPLLLKSIAQGAATQCYVATHPRVTENGAYFSDCNPAKSSRQGRDEALAERLWTVTEEIVAGL
jgi:NAD(P)-dependent dehydrogenase (short-subunit alcohol dehydrogenase family)